MSHAVLTRRGTGEAGPSRTGHDRSQAQHLEGLLRAATTYAIIGTAPDGTITIFSDGAEHMLGYRAREVVGKATPLLIHDPDEVAARARTLGIPAGFQVFTGDALANQPETPLDREWTYVRKDGSRLPVALNVVATRDEQGAVIGFIGIARDLTAEKQAESGRLQLERQRDAFVAHAAHELRTPIAGIKASIGVVRANEPPETPEPLRRLLANIDLAADRLTHLTNDLLELCQLQSGVARLQKAPLDVREVARRAVRAVAPLMETRGQRIELALPTRSLLAAVDSALLERALVRLLHNAHKYASHGGTVGLALRRRQGQAVFAITDDGPGIPLEEQERIFERFFHPDPDTHRPMQGTGLGLAAARAVARVHGGRLWLESSPGAGATFHIAVPVWPSNARVT